MIRGILRFLAWAGAQPEVALRGSGSTVAPANSLRVTQGPELGGQLLRDTFGFSQTAPAGFGARQALRKGQGPRVTC